MAISRLIRSKPAVVALALAVSAGTATADGAGSRSRAISPALSAPAASSSASYAAQIPSSADRTFLQKASEGNVFEVKAGALAEKKANKQNIKCFGQWMTTQHTMLENKLKSVAGSVGVTPETSLIGQHQQGYASLEKLSGDAFDQAYVEIMAKEHRKDLKTFQDEAEHGKSSEVKKFASEGATVIQRHLNRIKQVGESDGIQTEVPD